MTGPAMTSQLRGGGEPTLLPCPFCGYAVTEEDGLCAWDKDEFGDTVDQVTYTGVSCGGCSAFVPINAHDRAEAIAAWNTRAPPGAEAISAPVEGWVSDERLAARGNPFDATLFRAIEAKGEHEPSYVLAVDSPQGSGLLIEINHNADYRVDDKRAKWVAAALNAALSATYEHEESFYDIGKRDGYEDAIQELDVATGGDGEFKGSTFAGETVDVPVMRQRIIDRRTAPPPSPSADARVVELTDDLRRANELINAAVDDYNKAEERVVELEMALREIARQKTYDELTDDQREAADWQGGFDTAVYAARVVLINGIARTALTSESRK